MKEETIRNSKSEIRNRFLGFTFIELVFVVTTLAVLLAVVLPRFGQSFESLQTERVTFETAQFLRYAQATAIAQRKVIQCTFDAETHTLRLELKQGETVTPLSGPLGKGKALPPGLRLTIASQEQPTETLLFFPNGTSEQDAVVTISDDAGGRYTISIDETTGHVSVLSGPPAR